MGWTTAATTLMKLTALLVGNIAFTLPLRRMMMTATMMMMMTTVIMMMVTTMMMVF